MAVTQSLMREAPPQPAAVAFNGDMRRHRRLHLAVKGRFLGPGRTEHSCATKDLSAGGAFLECDAALQAGDKIIAYFEHLGGLDCVVTRATSNGVAVQFKTSEHKKEKLAAQIMWLANRDDFPDELGRVHERVNAGGRRTLMRLDDGITIDVEILDLSASGASLGTHARPDLGEVVTIGKIAAIVRRHHENGIAVQFVTVQSQDALRTHFP